MAGRNLLVTGKPGVGKTTLIERAIGELRGKLRLAGFTTRELRDADGERVGFEIVTVGGERGELARTGLGGKARVGRYGVNVEELERLALPEIRRRDADLIAIDEIGKMECASGRFRRAVEDALDSPVDVLATIGISHLPFFEALRARPDVEVLTVTERNRDGLAAEILARLAASENG